MASFFKSEEKKYFIQGGYNVKDVQVEEKGTNKFKEAKKIMVQAANFQVFRYLPSSTS